MSRAISLAPDERRAQLLDTARRVFSDRGYHKASVADIIDLAGVARGTFYRYFDSKRQVFEAVIERLMGEVTDAIAPIDISQNIQMQVIDNLRCLIQVLTDQRVGRLLFTQAVGIDAEGDAALRDFYTQATNRIQRALEDGQRLGIVRAGSCELTATCVMGMIKQPVFISMLDGRDCNVDALVDEVFGMLAGGVLRFKLPQGTPM